MSRLVQRPLDFGWVDAAIEAWVRIEETNARRTVIRYAMNTVYQAIRLGGLNTHVITVHLPRPEKTP